jgi:hypothetical protein
VPGSGRGGLELIGALLWRGVVYGLADGLLLSAFPILAVFAMFAGTKARERILGTVAIGLAALTSLNVAETHRGLRGFPSHGSRVRAPSSASFLFTGVSFARGKSPAAQ